MILAYFSSGFRPFLGAHDSVVCFLGSLFSANVAKIAFFEGSEKEWAFQ